MTFIASIIAKDGIAVIADSLVSSMEKSLNQKKWNDFISIKQKASKDGDFKLTEEEITELFEVKSSHTKDYENKLFTYDEYTVITTAGGAFINNKNIEALVLEIQQKTKVNKNYTTQTIEDKIKEFCSHLEAEVKIHLSNFHEIHDTVFIVSNYDKYARKGVIYKVTILSTSSDSLKITDHIFVRCGKEDAHIVCDGQPGIANRILYGGVLDSLETHNDIHESTKNELELHGISEGNGLPIDFFKNLKEKQSRDLIASKEDDIQLYSLTGLSLQQAVDLVYLLLKVERDFQAYTKRIPNVGGLIKLATINDEGVNFILGKTIIKPTRHL